MEIKIEVFNNIEFGEIRVIEKEGGDIWFVGKEIAELLGYASPRSVISKKIDYEDKGVAKNGNT